LELRTDNTFPFQSLTLEIAQTIIPEGREEHFNKVCSIIDQNGNMMGAGVSLFQYTFPLNNIRLNRGDSLHITVVHSMKREILPGVADVGITLIKE
jgi:gliding motility-associated lipoprotein GldH